MSEAISSRIGEMAAGTDLTIPETAVKALLKKQAIQQKAG
jgi:hypothetical protein